MGETALLTFVAALFSIMNPIGGVGIFAGMTADRSDAEAKRTAWTCAIACAIAMLIVCWTGSAALELFGIGVDELRAAGGVIVLLIALNMLFNKEEHRQTEEEATEAQTRKSIAIVPLAIPIVAGPGTLATVIIAAERHTGIMAKVDLSVAILGLCAFTGLLFAYARPIANWLGENGMAVVTRIMGMILAAIAMGMLVTGLKGMIPAIA